MTSIPMRNIGNQHQEAGRIQAHGGRRAGWQNRPDYYQVGVQVRPQHVDTLTNVRKLKDKAWKYILRREYLHLRQ